MNKKPLNHKLLGGDAVDTTRDFSIKLPQRRPNASMTPDELLRKAVTGSSKQQVNDAWGDMIKRTQ